LYFVNIGDEAIIKYIKDSGIAKQKLEALGLTPGTKITILSNNMNGSFVVYVRGCKLILGNSITSKIIVKVI
jgi:ferrous iron transport protein A